MAIKLKSIEEVLESIIDENANSEILKAIKGKKTSVGVSVEKMYKEYLDALHKVVMLPSSIKPYIEEDGVDFPAKNEINKAIDACNKVINKLK